MSAPSLDVHPEAPYPAEALRDRVEGNVGLELDVDAAGKVTGVRVTTPVGHGFDEAASEAARHFTFKPARRRGVPVPSTVQFTYEFHLPPPPPPSLPPPAAAAPPAAVVLPPGAGVQTAPDQSTLVLGTKPISAASSFTVQDRNFQLRGIGTVQDILRVTPGLVIVQHSGGGKANQYFLRGFDADHGTDLLLMIDGVPINMVSHAHGQGFADTNFIIPEVVERVEITKGPYFVSQGDLATAGAVNMVSRERFEHSAVAAGLVGSPGHGNAGYRALVIASPSAEGDAVKATFAAEIGRENGPFENPDRWDRYRLFNKVTFAPTPSSTLSLTQMSYAGNWHGSGQIPARAVDQGLITRWGTLDASEGGNTARHQLALQYRVRAGDSGELRALAYAGTYRFNMFSNFTLFLRDPVNGDEIEQADQRTFYGGKVSYRVAHQAGPVVLTTTIGADGRSDDIHEELWNVAARRRLSAVRGNDVTQTLIGAYVDEEIAPLPWLRAHVGGRADLLSFAVKDTLMSGDPDAPASGVGAAHQFSPKTSLIVTALDRARAKLDLFVNYGHGFHSNDVRGVFTPTPVTPLARARSAASWARARGCSNAGIWRPRCGSSISTARRSGSATRGRRRRGRRRRAGGSSSRRATS